MTMKKRTFTKEEKLNIIKEASEKGITETLEKYGVYKASYYDWKKKLEEIPVILTPHSGDTDPSLVEVQRT